MNFQVQARLRYSGQYNGGRTLGDNMLLVDGSYAEAVRYEKMPNIESVTYNYTLAAAGIA